MDQNKGESVGFPLVLLQCSFPSRQPQGQFAHAVCRHHQEGDEQHPAQLGKGQPRRAEKAAAVAGRTLSKVQKKVGFLPR